MPLSVRNFLLFLLVSMFDNDVMLTGSMPVQSWINVALDVKKHLFFL